MNPATLRAKTTELLMKWSTHDTFWHTDFIKDLEETFLSICSQERESCAALAEDLFANDTPMDYNQSLMKTGRKIAEAIRKRGEQSI